MLHLMNSAMLPQPGVYEYRAISQATFAEILRKNAGNFRSYIGYPQTAMFIERISGVPVPVSRDKTMVSPGDVMLVCKLRGRVADPKTKGLPVPEEFEFGSVQVRDTYENL